MLYAVIIFILYGIKINFTQIIIGFASQLTIFQVYTQNFFKARVLVSLGSICFELQLNN